MLKFQLLPAKQLKGMEIDDLDNVCVRLEMIPTVSYSG